MKYVKPLIFGAKRLDYSSDAFDVDMPTCPSRLGRLAKKLYGKKYLGLCFLIPVLVLSAIYIAMRVYPAGDNSVLVLDLNGQYVYFYEALRDLVTKGGSFLYTFRRALGGEFMGIFAYYLASPLSYIVALFPKENMTEAIASILLLKCGLCGFTFGFYAHKTRGRRPVAAVTFSTMWALCAYAVVMQHNLMWTDNIILFPLVLLGIEKLTKHGKIGLYTVTLALSILSNFYIGFMTCIFSGIYFFLYYLSKEKDEINPYSARHHFIKSLARFGAASLCAVCIGAVIILPTYYSLTLGKTTFSDPSFIPDSKFDPADALTKLYFGSYDTVRPEGLPFLYTGMLTLLLAPLYFFCKKIKLREKVVAAVTVVIFALSMNITTLDLVWHGFQKPNWLNYRYAYMLCFFLLFWAMRASEHLREIRFRWIAVSFAASSALVVLLQKMGYENLTPIKAVIPSVLILFVYALILRGTYAKSFLNRRTAAFAIALLVPVEMLASGLVNLSDLDDDVIYSNRVGYRTFLDRVSVAAEDISERDDTFFRTEKTFMRKSNDNMALGFYGLSGSTSTLNAETVKFLNRFGYASKSHWSKYLGYNPVSDSLLGVKYIIAERNDTVYEADKIHDYPDENMTTYKNPYALSVFTAVSPKLTNSPFTDEGVTSPFERLNSLVSYMLGGSDENVFREATPISITPVGAKESVIAGHLKYEKIGNDTKASVKFRIACDSDEPLYCYFPSKYTRDSDLLLNNSKISTYFENDTYRIVCLGDFEPGEEIEVSLELKKNELYIESEAPYFCYLDVPVFERSMTELSKYGMDARCDTDDTIYGTITVPEGKTQIFTSVPYDEGWRVICDGNEVEIQKVLDALITFELEPGEHELRLEYRPDSVTKGNIISVFGVAAFIMISLGTNLLSKKRRRAAPATKAPESASEGCGAKMTDEETQPENEVQKGEEE
ncbi:MAG: YfhO family protein [Clostridia bacterium]|nr:YfhO family protein [Clostridia bacterium]